MLASICLSRSYYSYSYYTFFPTWSLTTYLLLQEWSDPWNSDIISKLGIGRREFLILAGKFQLVDSLWGKQVPHYKHKRRSTTYLLLEIPVKNRESLGRGVNTRENCRVNFFAWFLPRRQRFAVQMQRSIRSWYSSSCSVGWAPAGLTYVLAKGRSIRVRDQLTPRNSLQWGTNRQLQIIMTSRLTACGWGNQVPHYKHKRRSTTYLLREIPVKNR